MNKEETKSNNKYSVENQIKAINKTIQRTSNWLKLISKVIKKSKTEGKWRCYDYQEISSCINEIEFQSGIALQSLETRNITIYDNWTKKVAENKALISKAEEELFPKERNPEENTPKKLKRKKNFKDS